MLADGEPALASPYPGLEDINPVTALPAHSEPAQLGIPNEVSGLESIDCAGGDLDFAIWHVTDP